MDTQQELLEIDLPDDVLEHLDDPEIRARWPEELTSLLDVSAQALQPQVGAERARRLAAVVVRAIAHYHGGRQVYLPRGDALDRALRDRRIWEEFDGRNVPELARRHRLTDVQVYAILREQRAIHRRRTEPGLFDDQ